MVGIFRVFNKNLIKLKKNLIKLIFLFLIYLFLKFSLTIMIKYGIYYIVHYTKYYPNSKIVYYF